MNADTTTQIWDKDLYCSDHGEKMTRIADWEFDIFTGKPRVNAFTFQCPTRGCRKRSCFGVTYRAEALAERVAGAPPSREHLIRKAKREQHDRPFHLFIACATLCMIVIFVLALLSGVSR